MPSITDIAAALTGTNTPVLCLDTCDILKVVQGLHQGQASQNPEYVGVVGRLLQTLDGDPERVLVVVTDLVVLEWNQNIGDIRESAERFLTNLDETVRRTHRASELTGNFLPSPTQLSTGPLVDDLVALSQALLDRATRIEIDPDLVRLAVGRVFDRRRPSHDGHLKDSVHLEHYLELARRLRSGGFNPEIVLVSGNRSDFWNGSLPSIHPDLRPELDDPAVGMRFFGSLEAAIGFLRL